MISPHYPPSMEPVFSSSCRIFRFGLFEADVARNTLNRGGVRVKIQDQPFRVLILLLERPGEIVKREELRQKLWPEGTYVDFDGSLNVILKKLRAALDEDADNPRFIETVPRRGYRFIAPVAAESGEGKRGNGSDTALQPSALPAPREIEAIASAGTLAPNSNSIVTPALSNASARRQPPLVIYAASAFVIVSLLAAGWFAKHRKASFERAAGFSVPVQAAAPLQLRKSVAVLGFRNLSERGDDAWLGTAFAEMLRTELAGGGTLRLVSGEEVANLRVSAPWPQTDTLDRQTTARVGGALSSDVLVLGSYTKVGGADGQLRVDVRLQEAKSGEVLTEVAETGSTQDLFRVIARVGARLRDRLGVPALAETDQAGVLASLPLDRDAAQFYAHGLAKLRDFDALAARDLLQQASMADPKFPLAHLMLARAWSELGDEQKRKEEAKKALDLSAGLPRAERLQVEGDYYESLADHDKAVSSYRALFDLFPDSVEYGLQLATAQNAAGHGDQSVATLAQLRRLP